jgi:hypothetical protein
MGWIRRQIRFGSVIIHTPVFSAGAAPIIVKRIAAWIRVSWVVEITRVTKHHQSD